MSPHRPGDAPFTKRTPRVVAAARLHRRRDRDATGRFLVEGPQAVREALTEPDRVHELFATAEAAGRHADLLGTARRAGVTVSAIAADASAALTETITPQGLFAVCAQRERPLAAALRPPPRLVAVLVGIRDPGNAGTVLRTADAAGAELVVFAGDAVDPYNGKCVRASAGSLFHVGLAREPDPVAAVAALREAGLRVLAAAADGEADLDQLLDSGALGTRTGWLFGSEAHGLPAAVAAAADARVRVPIHGRAESLNLGAAAAVCLYASARASRPARSGTRQRPA